ncbi:MAG: HlyD family secretion protein [Terracidiphilus sp.]|nr:HlyD family secretion protein [Terracidiphilus sp.]
MNAIGSRKSTDSDLKVVGPSAARNGARRSRLHRNAIAVASVFLLATAAIALYPVYASFYAITNDAQVDGHILPVNARVGGTVTWVSPNAENTRTVAGNELLALLDTNDYAPSVERLRGEVNAGQSQVSSAQLEYAMAAPTAKSRLQGAHAAVAEAEAEVASSVSDIRSKEAKLAQVRAAWEQMEADRKRYQPLVSTHEISNSEYDRHSTAATTAHEQVEISAAELKAAQTAAEASRHRLAQRKAELAAADVVPQSIGNAQARIQQMSGKLHESEAALHEAQLNLGYTSIRAPLGGVVGQRQFELGQRVEAGHLMMTVTPLNNLWVTANYKETQLHRMRIGQSATIKVDAYGMKLRGHIESIGGATGARYSLLPPENATGNYVKVVQRVPVRIHIDDTIDPKRPLLPGMSAEVSVKLF